MDKTQTSHAVITPASRVVIIVPMYRSHLSPEEETSLESTVRVFGRRDRNSVGEESALPGRDIVVVKPAGLDLSEISKRWPELKFSEFDPTFFDGIRGYNRLMTSADFYERFADYQYMLIAQLDSYTFRDDLDSWCARGYDYVGAPWLKRPLNRFAPISWIKMFKDRQRRHKGLYSKIALYDRVGNGGYSLRKIATHAAACRKYASELSSLNRIGPKGSPEDVFWAFRPEFTYPSAREALDFSFDQYPRYCFRLTAGHLPMGCHGWTSRKMRRFWRPRIPLPLLILLFIP